jgi:uncharacterized membrane protein
MTPTVTIGKAAPLHVQVRHVPVTQSLEWLNRGWADVKKIGLPGLAHGLLIAVLGAVLLMLGSTHFYFVAAAVTGYLLVGPAMTAGLCELARRREAREALSFDDSLQGLARNPDGMLHFSAVLALIALLWFVISAVLLQSVFSVSAPSLAVVLWGGAMDITPTQTLGYVVCGGVLAAVVFAMSVVAVPLIIDRHASASEAIRISVRATLTNLPAMLVWAGVIVGLTAIGFATFLVGMVVVAPLLGYATWHAYRDLVT